jgi:Na+/H+-dicarboxylate symporter
MAILIGFAIILAGEEAAPAAKGIHSFGVVFMKCMDIILRLSPVGVFCLICPVVASNGASILGSLAMVLLAAYVCYLVHMLVVYSAAVGLLGGMRPLDFLKGQLPAMIFAFSSASSVGTLPVNMKGCEKMGADPEISSFVLPLGATINMDGTAIYQGVCAIFIAACYGVRLTPGQMVTIVLTATLASIGTAGVPGSGLIMLTVVLNAAGLPLEAVGLLAGVDRFLNMGRMIPNIFGDGATSLVISKLEGKLGDMMTEEEYAKKMGAA